jgi:hypothetical protein
MIGNDVVDLRDEETRPGRNHPRFDARVFAPAERRWLAGRSAPAGRWLLWAAKEAAWKALRRLDPRIVFSPSRFLVVLESESSGWVSCGGVRLELAVAVEEGAVHAIARLPLVPAASVVAAARRGVEGDDPSAAVRRFAVESIAGRREIPERELHVDTRGRIPELAIGDRALAPLSLSHHGEVIGFAAVLPVREAVS